MFPGKALDISKRKPGRPRIANEPKLISEQVQNPRREHEVYPQYLVVNNHTRVGLEVCEQIASKNIGVGEHDLQITIKSEPESDEENMTEEVDYCTDTTSYGENNSGNGSILKRELEKPNEQEDTLKPLLRDRFPFDKDFMSSDKQAIQEEYDEDGQVVDIAWMVETIDTDSDGEMQSDSSQEMGDFRVDADNASTVSSAGSKKRKRVVGDDRKEKSGIMKTPHHDVKLSMKPVVVLRDVIQQILCDELR